MTLSKRQKKFTENISKLISFAIAQGYQLTFGEAYRPQSQIFLNYYGYDLTQTGVPDEPIRLIKRNPTSKTLFSRHGDRLAVDFNLFKDGKLLTTVADYKVLGDFWTDLDLSNVWGGDWNRNHNSLDESFSDFYHFEMKPQ